MFKRWRAAVAALGMALSLAGCGGGGGGGDVFHINLSKDSVALDAEEGQSASDTVVATIEGTYNDTVYVGAMASTDAIGDVQISFSGSNAYVYIASNPALPAGTHTGTLDVLVCSDQACNHQIGGSPFHIAYTVKVHAGLKTTPAQVDASWVSGQARPSQAVTVQLPEGATDYTVYADGHMMEVTDKTAHGFVLRPLPTSSGYYETYVQIDAAGRSMYLPVRYSVEAPAGGEHDLILDRTDVSLTATEGASGDAQPVGVSPPTWDPEFTTGVDYLSGADWLVAVRTSKGLALHADATHLAQGTYQAWLNVRYASWAGTPGQQVVSVSLTVGPGLVRPADRSINVNADTAVAGLSGSAAMAMADGVERPWSAETDVDWLKLDNPTGRTGTNLKYHVDQALLAALANGAVHEGHITVTPQPSTISAVTFTVSVNKRLPQVNFVAPFAQPTGRANSLLVRGLGFSGLADLNSRVTVAGVTGATVKVVNDTELKLELPATATAGSHTVSIDNALGMGSTANAFSLYDASDLAYAKLDSYGEKRGLVFDPLTRSMYTVNVDNHTVIRFAFDGTQWTRTTRAIPNLQDIGLAPDASVLLAVSLDGTVRRLDPQTLAVLSSHSYGGVFMDGYGQGNGIAITNDGKAWLTAGDYWGTPITFDLKTHVFTPVPTDGVSTTFYHGPWSVASRNGERLVMSQSSGVSPSPPMLYADAKNSLLHENGVGLEFFYQASLSDTGDRLFLDGYEVRDAAFNLVGRTTLPDNNVYGWATALSPDGRRAYVYAYAIGNSAEQPRVYVFDSSQPRSQLPLLGRFDVTDWPTCIDVSCGARTASTVSPDGKTWLLAGHGRMLVVPIPALYQSAQSGSLRQRASGPVAPKTSSGIQRWER